MWMQFLTIKIMKNNNNKFKYEKKREKRKHHSQYGTYGVYFITYWVIDNWCMQKGWLGVCREQLIKEKFVLPRIGVLICLCFEIQSRAYIYSTPVKMFNIRSICYGVVCKKNRLKTLCCWEGSFAIGIFLFKRYLRLFSNYKWPTNIIRLQNFQKMRKKL